MLRAGLVLFVLMFAGCASPDAPQDPQSEPNLQEPTPALDQAALPFEMPEDHCWKAFTEESEWGWIPYLHGPAHYSFPLVNGTMSTANTTISLTKEGSGFGVSLKWVSHEKNSTWRNHDGEGWMSYSLSVDDGQHRVACEGKNIQFGFHGHPDGTLTIAQEALAYQHHESTNETTRTVVDSVTLVYEFPEDYQPIIVAPPAPTMEASLSLMDCQGQGTTSGFYVDFSNVVEGTLFASFPAEFSVEAKVFSDDETSTPEQPRGSGTVSYELTQRHWGDRLDSLFGCESATPQSFAWELQQSISPDQPTTLQGSADYRLKQQPIL